MSNLIDNKTLSLENFISKVRKKSVYDVLKHVDPKEVNKILFLLTTNNVTKVIRTLKNDDIHEKCQFITGQDNWPEKLLEIFLTIQNYNVLRIIGFSLKEINYLIQEFSYNNTNFTTYLNKTIKILYFLCDNLKDSETNKLIELVQKLNYPPNSRKDEKLDLEDWILHWIQNNLIFIDSDAKNSKFWKIVQTVSVNNKILKSLDHHVTTFQSDFNESSIANDDSRNENFTVFKKNAEKKTDTNEKCLFLNGEHKRQCFIYNQCTFTDSQFPRRDGTEKDVKKLEETFKNCKFDVDVFHDAEVEEFLTGMKLLEDYGTYGSVFIIILSHGTKGEVQFKDGALSIELIKKKICHENLRETFKLLILQACQGNTLGIENSQSNIVPDGPLDLSEEGQPLNYLYFGMFQATIENFVSMRDKKKGTWFIQELCNVIENHTPMTVYEMTQKVIEKIVQKRASHPNGTDKQIVQVPTYSTQSPKDYTIPQYSS